MKLKWLIMLLTAVVTIAGCDDLLNDSDSESSLSPRDLLPLAVGNQWVYATSDDTITKEIVSDAHRFEGRVAYEMASSGYSGYFSGTSMDKVYYAYEGENVIWYDENNAEWNILDDFRNFPNLGEGDTIFVDSDTVSVSDTSWGGGRITATVYRTNASRSVGAGVFDNCYVVKIEDIRGVYDLVTGELISNGSEIAYYNYYVPGVGLVYREGWDLELQSFTIR